jgi:hypothetical protein
MDWRKIEDIERCLVWIKIYIEGISKIIKHYQEKEEILDYEKSIGNILDNQNKAKYGLRWLKQELKGNSFNKVLPFDEELRWFKQKLRKRKIVIEDIENLIKEADIKWQKFEKEKIAFIAGK